MHMSHSSWMICFLCSIVSSCFSFCNFYSSIFNFTTSYLDCVIYSDVAVLLISSFDSSFFLSFAFSSMKLPIWPYILSNFFFRNFSISAIVILNSISDASKIICEVLVFGPDDFFISWECVLHLFAVFLFLFFFFFKPVNLYNTVKTEVTTFYVWKGGCIFFS